jgi:Holliday junction DNA helicase RuvA
LIGWLRGHVVATEADGTVVIDVGGVGYELETPLGTSGRLALDADGAVTLHVHTHVREDALDLFGFATAEDRTAFRTLLGISKVGPRLALAVLGALSLRELVELVETGQVGLLTKVPGVGKRTAERMVLELRGKLSPVAAGPLRAAPRVGAESSQAAILHEALVRMGFKPSEADRAVAALGALDRPMGELIREALAILSR